MCSSDLFPSHDTAKSRVIEELQQSESQIKRELKEYEKNLAEQMKKDLEQLQSSLSTQENEQKESINKLLKWVGWKVLALTSLLSIVIGLFLGTQIPKQATKLEQFIESRSFTATDGNNYLKFQTNELIYDQQKKLYYYKIN